MDEKTHSNDVTERAMAVMQSGESCHSVAVRIGVVPSSGVKWTDRARRTGLVRPAKMGGYCRAILAPHRDCLLAPWVFDGSVNGDIFRTYVEHVLIPTLRPGDVVVMDILGRPKARSSVRPIEMPGRTCCF